MLWVYGHYKIVNSYSAGMDESDVYRRHILTSKVDPRANPYSMRIDFRRQILTSKDRPHDEMVKP